MKSRVYIISMILAAVLGAPELTAQDTLSQAAKLKAKMDSLRHTLTNDKGKPEESVQKAVDTIAIEEVYPDSLMALEPHTPVQKTYSASDYYRMADSARLAYDFSAALRYAQEALSSDPDAMTRLSIEEEIVLSRNGLNMMDYSTKPVTIAKQRFSLKDFFLFYPLKDKSWRKAPNQLDSFLGEELVTATYLPEDATSVYYSTGDREGIRNIFQSFYMDSLWTRPELVNENITSTYDEIYPMVSPDGRTLTFASKGLYGMGGYDLYQCKWDKEIQEWSAPINMGIPYSSPYDDFLFINTEDGRYSIFASNRECSRDSVYIYVLEFDGMPARNKLSDAEAVRDISSLVPQSSKVRIDNTSASAGSRSGNEQTQRYTAMMSRVRELRDSIYNVNKELDELRARVGSEEEDVSALLSEIQAKEKGLPEGQRILDEAVKELQAIEKLFLASGRVIDADKAKAETDREVVGAASGYTFTKNSYGPAISLGFEESIPERYEFSILPESQFAESKVLPDGIVYQIQLCSLPQKAGAEDFSGLSPIYENLTSTLRYDYAVGLFRSYREALSHLNSVRKRGFSEAYIIAFKDGKTIATQTAKQITD